MNTTAMIKDLLKAKLADDGIYGDSKEIADCTSEMKNGEQHYTVIALNWRDSTEVERTYSNGELLGFMFDKITSLEQKIDGEGTS
jgi:hypothetical protein